MTISLCLFQVMATLHHLSTWTNRHCFIHLCWCFSDDANSENNGENGFQTGYDFYDFVFAIETKLLSRTRPRNVKKKSVFCDVCSHDCDRLSWWIRRNVLGRLDFCRMLLRMVRYTFHSGLRWLRSRMDCTFTSSRIFKSKISVRFCFDHLYFSPPKHGSPVCGCWFSKLGTKLEKKFILENKTQHTQNNNNNITNVK